jgi:hypothetical protein
MAINGATKLAELNENEWTFIDGGRDFSNETTAIKLANNKIFIQYIGGDFEKTFVFWFEYSQAALDEMWQYEFREDYPHVFGKEIDDLDWVNEISSTPYTILNDLNYSCNYAGLLEQEGSDHE